MALPLEGIKVVEMAGLGPAPYGVMLLADLGADVVRVDRSLVADGLSAWSEGLSRGRRSICVDIRTPDGLRLLLELVDRADVFVESARPGVAERLGFGPEVCCSSNPRLLYARMSGWGQDGPWAQRAGHDLGYIALAGALYNVGYPDRPPLPPQAMVGDFGGGGTFLALGILAALLERTRSGLGQIIDAAVLDGAASLTTFSHGLRAAGALTDRRGDSIADGSVPFYSTYETRDGKYITVAALEPHFYAELMAGLAVAPETYPQDDRARWPALREFLTTTFRSEDREVWERRFDGTDACVVPVLTLDEATRHPQAVSRQVFHRVGERVQPGPAPRLSRTPGRVGASAPRPGEHSAVIARELGHDDEGIARLIESGALAQLDSR